MAKLYVEDVNGMGEVPSNDSGYLTSNEGVANSNGLRTGVGGAVRINMREIGMAAKFAYKWQGLTRDCSRGEDMLYRIEATVHLLDIRFRSEWNWTWRIDYYFIWM